MFTVHSQPLSPLGFEGSGGLDHLEPLEPLAPSHQVHHEASSSKPQPEEKLPALLQPTLPPRTNNAASYAIWKTLLGPSYSHVSREIKQLPKLSRADLEARLNGLIGEADGVNAHLAELDQQLASATSLPSHQEHGRNASLDDAADELALLKATRASVASKMAALRMQVRFFRKALLGHADAHELQTWHDELQFHIDSMGTPEPQDKEALQKLAALKSELHLITSALRVAQGYVDACVVQFKPAGEANHRDKSRRLVLLNLWERQNQGLHREYMSSLPTRMAAWAAQSDQEKAQNEEPGVHYGLGDIVKHKDIRPAFDAMEPLTIDQIGLSNLADRFGPYYVDIGPRDAVSTFRFGEDCDPDDPLVLRTGQAISINLPEGVRQVCDIVEGSCAPFFVIAVSDRLDGLCDRFAVFAKRQDPQQAKGFKLVMLPSNGDEIDPTVPSPGMSKNTDPQTRVSLKFRRLGKSSPTRPCAAKRHRIRGRRCRYRIRP